LKNLHTSAGALKTEKDNKEFSQNKTENQCLVRFFKPNLNLKCKNAFLFLVILHNILGKNE
jgi:hypothetical protein